jgi:hypothetical protein
MMNDDVLKNFCYKKNSKILAKVRDGKNIKQTQNF